MFFLKKFVICIGYHIKKKTTSIVKCEELAFASISFLKMFTRWNLIRAYKVPLFTFLQSVKDFLSTNIIQPTMFLNLNKKVAQPFIKDVIRYVVLIIMKSNRNCIVNSFKT
jgi:hypothetical protein